MSEQDLPPGAPAPRAREPVFLLPGAVSALAAFLVLIQFASTTILNADGQNALLFWFAFQPYRIILAMQDPSYALPLLWTPFTHAFLHGGWEHVLINVAWLIIFATPVARRYGTGGMMALFLVSAAAGAAFFAATTLYDGVFLVGASGGIAGLTGAAIRFIFQPVLVGQNPETGERVVLGRQLAGFREVWGNPSSRYFSLVWLVLNAAVPLLPALIGSQLGVAWQAHLGGFFAGFLLVPLFERRV